MITLCVGIYGLVLDPVRDLCEAYTVFCFCCLIIYYCGGFNRFSKLLNENDHQLLNSSKGIVGKICCCCFYTEGKLFLLFIYFTMTQFLICKPSFSVVLERHSNHDLNKVGWAFRILTAITLFICLIGLLALLRSSYTLIKHKNPIAKILSIKVLVAVTIVQKIILTALVNNGTLKDKDNQTAYERSIRIQHVYIILSL
jgi:hypothetical protein